MSYRSEVAITIPNEAYEELVAKSKVECICAYELIKSGFIFQTEKFTTMYFKWVRWCEDYEDVQFIESFIHKVSYVFNRIGEEYNDIESHEDNITDYNIFDCVGVVRYLDVESAGEKIIGKGDEYDGFRQQAV